MCFLLYRLPLTGVQVQLHRTPASRPTARIASAEHLSMAQLLELYAANTGMGQEVLDAARTALQVRILGSEGVE